MAYNTELLDFALDIVNKLNLNEYLYNFKIDNNMNPLGSYNRYKKLLKINLEKIKNEYENFDFGLKFILFHELAHIEQIKQINETNHYMNNILNDCMIKKTEKDIEIYQKYHDYYIHEHNATMRSFILLIETCSSKEEMNYIIIKLKEYLEDIYKNEAPIEIVEKLKNKHYIFDKELSNDEKIMYGLSNPDIKCFIKKYAIDNE